MGSPREPFLTPAVDGITAIDTGMAGHRELNAVYLVAASQPTLIETGPGADGQVVVAALDRLGIGPDDLAHIVVTHIHVDHAGGAGSLLQRYPRARVWAHVRGAPHLVDPSRLIASTARTYGEDRMRAWYGQTLACPIERVASVEEGDSIPLGDRALDVIHAPGHASHQIALQDSVTGAMFTGEAIGSYLPWADAFRPALPPPEVDVELALDTVRRLGERHPSTLLTSHFGPVVDVDAGLERAAERIRDWSQAVRRHLESDPTADDDAVATTLLRQARREYDADSSFPFDLDRYDALGSIRMNAQGLSRYWRKRWEREATTAS